MKETVTLKLHNLSFSNFCCCSACVCVCVVRVFVLVSLFRARRMCASVCLSACLPACLSLIVMLAAFFDRLHNEYIFSSVHGVLMCLFFRVFMSKKILNINILLFEDKKSIHTLFTVVCSILPVQRKGHACLMLVLTPRDTVISYCNIFLRIRLTCTRTHSFARISKTKQTAQRERETCKEFRSIDITIIDLACWKSVKMRMYTCEAFWARYCLRLYTIGHCRIFIVWSSIFMSSVSSRRKSARRIIIRVGNQRFRGGGTKMKSRRNFIHKIFLFVDRMLKTCTAA